MVQDLSSAPEFFETQLLFGRVVDLLSAPEFFVKQNLIVNLEKVGIINIKKIMIEADAAIFWNSFMKVGKRLQRKI